MAIKTYYSRVNGCTYVARSGDVVQFLGNPAYLETDSEQLQSELDDLVKSSRGLIIFSDPASAPDMTAQIESMNAANRAAQAGVALAKAGLAVG